MKIFVFHFALISLKESVPCSVREFSLMRRTDVINKFFKMVKIFKKLNRIKVIFSCKELLIQ